jgi:AP2-like factor (ANT lineage)
MGKYLEKEGSCARGKIVYLGGHNSEEKAERDYDIATLKFWGPKTQTNFMQYQL